MLLLLLLPLFVTCAFAWPNGAPIDACGTLMPNHGVSSQNSYPPYEIITEKIGPHQYRVAIRGKRSDERFKGFILQGKNRRGEVIGSFNTLDGNFLGCGRYSTKDTITHRNNNYKSEITATWTSPQEEEDYVRFVATVVKEKVVFWTGISSGKSLKAECGAVLLVAATSLLMFTF